MLQTVNFPDRHLPGLDCPCALPYCTADCTAAGLRLWDLGELGVTEDLGTIVYRATLHRLPTESSIEGSQLSVSVDSDAEKLDQNAAPPPEEKGMSHRWRVTWFMALAFILCNMDTTAMDSLPGAGSALPIWTRRRAGQLPGDVPIVKL
ncbi:hypothetical protein WJX73_001875 [Symbiochloris irregularis]|uniref:Uncharacterized protein n=1 Tax=Symbiochloris irregularis TaxID=706552 RepID=A0AAW1PCC8_9CHLO